jgi:putative ABC transport system permease protein
MRIGAARRAITRWAWRLFRREWRQQALVLALVAVAVAATVFGIGAATHAGSPSRTTLVLPGADPQLASDVSAISKRVGPVEVIQHQPIAVPGSVATVDARTVSDAGEQNSWARSVAGRLPTRPGEVALSRGASELLSAPLGATWDGLGHPSRVVAIVENPDDLHDQFALVAPGQLTAPESTTIVLHGPTRSLRSLNLPSGSPIAINVESVGSGAIAGVLAMGTLGLLFVGLVAGAGFIVMAQRRERAQGKLRAMGATERHIRLVVLANGSVVGAVGGAAGVAAGLAAWFAFAPHLQTISGHRFDPFELPWVAIAAALALAIASSLIAAWWPARAATRASIVGALSGRRPRPRPAHRFAAAGLVILAAGVTLMVFARPRSTMTDPSPLRIIGGTLGITVGTLLLAPLAIAALAALGRRTPISVRLALRDLTRYQARSGSALAAITLAVGVAAAVAVSAATLPAARGPELANLPTDQVLVYLGAHGHEGAEVIPAATPTQLRSARSTVEAIARTLHTTNLVTLDAAVDAAAGTQVGPNGLIGKQPALLFHFTFEPVRPGDQRRGFSASPAATLYVATPQLLTHLEIDPASIASTTDVLTSRTDLAGTKLMAGGGNPATARLGHSAALPMNTSGPSTLLTRSALDRLGLSTIPSAWLVQAPEPITATQAGAARRLAATAGLTIETTRAPASGARLGSIATTVGIVLAMGVLAMTVGLIRAETANDLRTLAATGASSFMRRNLAASTAGALALLGGLLGVAGAYAALAAWSRRDLHPLTSVPLVNLSLLVVGLPLVAAGAAWLLAGREPAAIGRQPLE